MASRNLSQSNRTKTRSQVATEKQRAEDEMRKNEELKRQKTMFAPVKVLGPRDIFVFSKFPEIKVEDNAQCRTSVKEEQDEDEQNMTGSVESSVNYNVPMLKLEGESSIVVKVEETLDFNEAESSEQNCETFDEEEETSANVTASSKIENRSTILAAKKILKKYKTKPINFQSSKLKATNRKPEPKKVSKCGWMDSDPEIFLLFVCKLCNQRITADEKDAHRAMHIQQHREGLLVPPPLRASSSRTPQEDGRSRAKKLNAIKRFISRIPLE